MRNSYSLLLLITVFGCDQSMEAAHASPLVPSEALAEPNCKARQESPKAEETVVDIDVGAAPIRGLTGAPVTVVVYSDFQCPYCKRGAERLTELAAKYPDRVRVAFKHNPLPFHANAPRAAAAAIAAGQQGKFWEMHDLLFSQPGALDDQSFVAHAKTLGLDVDRFTRDMDDPSAKERIAADMADAARVGAKGTPTFFINGKRLTGAQPIAEFIALVEKS